MIRRTLRAGLVGICVVGSLPPAQGDAYERPRQVAGATAFWAGNPDMLARIIVPAPPHFAQRLDELEAVRAEMARTPWQSDLERHGVADFWEASFDGDCEDKALAGLEMLVARGWPRPAFGLFLRPGTSGRPDHAVLCVSIRGASGRSATAWCADALQPAIARLSTLPGPWRRSYGARAGSGW